MPPSQERLLFYNTPMVVRYIDVALPHCPAHLSCGMPAVNETYTYGRRVQTSPQKLDIMSLKSYAGAGVLSGCGACFWPGENCL